LIVEMHNGPQDDGQQGQRQKQLPDRRALHAASVAHLPAAVTHFLKRRKGVIYPAVADDIPAFLAPFVYNLNLRKSFVRFISSRGDSIRSQIPALRLKPGAELVFPSAGLRVLAAGGRPGFRRKFLCRHITGECSLTRRHRAL